MTNEEKQFLFRDLCARLPYGIEVSIIMPGDEIPIDIYIDITTVYALERFKRNEFTIKPYLRPMSSMTATENIEYQKRVKVIQDVERTLHWCDTPESIDWLDEHHFDYRGLIEKGLALEAPEGMYNN